MNEVNLGPQKQLPAAAARFSPRAHVTATAGANSLARVRQPLDNPRATLGQPSDSSLARVRQLLENPRTLTQHATAVFRRGDADGNGVLSLTELERLVPRLHAELGIRAPSEPEDAAHLARRRMRRFDLNGDGVLGASEFVELYRWALWRRYEDLDPPRFKRGDAVGGLRKGSPGQFYTLGKVLGAGQFGVVSLATHRRTGLERAMKTIHKEKAAGSGTPLGLLRQEIDVLALLDHPHILRLFEHYNDTENLYLIVDAIAGGELQDILNEHAERSLPMPEAWVVRVFAQVLEAVAYCHAKGVAHKERVTNTESYKHVVTWVA